MEDAVRQEYFELLRFQSVGADPARFKDTLDCASHLKRWLGRLGFAGEFVYPGAKADGRTPPVVFAERPGSGATLLVYGHYDVQPADPVSEWTSPPFEPTVADGRVRCRGAQDDKGQLFAFLCGLRDVLADAGASAPTVKVLLDGQEESGSEALTALLASGGSLRRRVGADVLLVCDTSAAEGLRPAIVAGLRGVGHFTIRLTAANRDLHSGEYGGLVPNPAQGIAELVASLHNPDGSIAVSGFRDGIEPPTAEEKRLAELCVPSKESCERDLGVAPVGGQVGRTAAERVSFDPTIEVNGIHSGYGGPGSKTVIPCEAFAKLSMRYVPGQSPRAAFDAVRAHLEARVPRGMKLDFPEVSLGAGGFRLPLASPVFRLAEDVLSGMDSRGPVFQWDGASIPVVSAIREASGAAPLIVGWGQPEDRIHSPDESYSFAQFDKARDWARRIVRAFCD